MTRRLRSNSRGSSLVAFAAVLFSLGLIAAFAGYGTLRQLLTPQWVRENIVPRVESVLGRKVTFEGLSLGLGEVILTGVRLSENPEFANNENAKFAVIERVELGLDVSALTEMRLVVNRLQLVRPYVRLYRLPDARWNISALLSDAKARSATVAPKPLEIDEIHPPIAAPVVPASDDKAKPLIKMPESEVASAEPSAAEPAEKNRIVAAEAPNIPFSRWGVQSLIDTLRTSLLDWTGWLIHEVHVEGGLLLVEDDAALYPDYARVAVRGISIEAGHLRLDKPIDFTVRAEILPNPERVWSMDADATFDISENHLTVNGVFDHFEPDLIISQLARPLHLAPKPKKPEPLKPFRLDADLKVARLPFWRFDATAVTGSIAFRRRTLELRNVRGRQAGGTLTANGSIRFEPTYAHHDLTVKLERAPFNEGIGKLLPAPWNDILGTQTLVVRGKFDDPRGHPFGDSALGIGVEEDKNAYLRATLVLDSPVLDLDALTQIAAGSEGTEARDYGPVDTGRLDAEVAVTLDRLRFRNIDFLNARVKASVRNSTIEIAALESGIENGGTASLSGNVVLDRLGFAYAARLDIDGADHGVLLRSVAKPNWGTRSGRTDVRLTMSGAGTKWTTIMPNLSAELGVVVHDGNIKNAEFMNLLANETGIDGFRDMDLLESGGVIRIANSRISTKKLTLGSDKARVLAKGSIGFDESLDMKIKLGFGPDSQRRILSKGVLLPYKHDENGWTNIPLIVTGTFSDPDITIASSALASTAVNAVPDATKRLGKESAKMTRAITDKAADVMPKPAGDLLRGAQNATERVIGGTYGSLEKLVRGLGRLLTGRATADTGKREEANTPSKAIEELSKTVDNGDSGRPKGPADPDLPEFKVHPRNRPDAQP